MDFVQLLAMLEEVRGVLARGRVQLCAGTKHVQHAPVADEQRRHDMAVERRGKRGQLVPRPHRQAPQPNIVENRAGAVAQVVALIRQPAGDDHAIACGTKAARYGGTKAPADVCGG